MQTYSFSDDTGNVNAVNMTNVNLLEETFRRILCLQSDEDDKDYKFSCLVLSSVLPTAKTFFIFWLLLIAYCTIYTQLPTEYVKHYGV